MKSMPNVKISRQDFERLITQNRYGSGGEGVICTTPSPHTLYKIFVEYETSIPVIMSDNKRKKIQELYHRHIEHSTQPLSTISLDGELIGYEMTGDQDDISLLSIHLPRRKKIEVLKRSSEILQYFASQGITYGDVKANNILVNRKTNQVKFCDMDNIKLDDYPIDLLNDYVDSIIESESDINPSVDAYMHNLMTLQLLNSPGITYDEIIYKLIDGKYHKKYKQEAHRALSTMVSSEQPFTGEYIAPYIKR